MASPRHSHRRARAGLGLPVGAAIGAVLVALGIGGGAVLALHDSDGGASKTASTSSAGGCGTVLTVSTAPGLVEPVRKVAAAYTRQTAGNPKSCVSVTVTGRSSADAVAALGSAPDTAPDVWIPESDHWLALARNSKAASLLPEGGPTIATSPTVIAIPKPMAAALNWPKQQFSWAQLRTAENDPAFWSDHGHKDWGPFVLEFAAPAESVASLQAVVAYTADSDKLAPAKITASTYDQSRSTQAAILDLERGAGVVPKSEAALLTDLRAADQAGTTLSTVSATPMQESDLVAYNRGVDGTTPKVPLVASYPTDGLYNQQIPFLVLTKAAADKSRAAAAAGLLAAFQAGPGQAELAAAGFRSPAGVNQTLTSDSGAIAELPKTTPTAMPGDALAGAQSLFSSIHHRGAILAVVDTSGSMSDIVPGTGKTKLQIAIDACLQGVRLFAQDNLVGVWQFSTDQDGSKPYRERSPVVPLNAKGRYGTHLDDLLQVATDIKAGGDTALYETALAAYQNRTQNYVPGKLNNIVLLTDGKEDTPDNPHPLQLSDLIKQLEKLYDPKRPVHLITIAYGSDADPAVLSRISTATDAQSYVSKNPKDILNVIIDAVLDSGK